MTKTLVTNRLAVFKARIRGRERLKPKALQ